MELKLENLAPYLPYRLNMHYESECRDWVENWELTPDKISYALEFNNKPILRHLSDLKSFNTSNELSQREEAYIMKNKTCHWLSYHSMQVLLKNHFDVFGLIESNLAVDINTLK